MGRKAAASLTTEQQSQVGKAVAMHWALTLIFDAPAQVYESDMGKGAGLLPHLHPDVVRLQITDTPPTLVKPLQSLQ